MMADSRFGQAGASVVIGEFMEGREIGVLTFADGTTIKSFPPGQDHK
jgi:phosphoribosylamine-glycine ligase